MKYIIAFLILTGVAVANPPVWVNDPFERVLWTAIVANNADTSDITEAEFDLIRRSDGDIWEHAADGDRREYIGNESDMNIVTFGDNDGYVAYTEFAFGTDIIDEDSYITDGSGRIPNQDANLFPTPKLKKDTGWSSTTPKYSIRLKRNINLELCDLQLQFSILLYHPGTDEFELKRADNGYVTYARQNVNPGSGDEVVDEYIYYIDFTSLIANGWVLPYRSELSNAQPDGSKGYSHHIRSYVKDLREPS